VNIQQLTLEELFLLVQSARDITLIGVTILDVHLPRRQHLFIIISNQLMEKILILMRNVRND